MQTSDGLAQEETHPDADGTSPVDDRSLDSALERVRFLEWRLEQTDLTLARERRVLCDQRDALEKASARESESARRIKALEVELSTARSEIGRLEQLAAEAKPQARTEAKPEAKRSGPVAASNPVPSEHALGTGVPKAEPDGALAAPGTSPPDNARAAVGSESAALESARERIQILEQSRDRFLQRLLDWQRSRQEAVDEPTDLSDFIAELRAEIMTLSRENAAASAREAELRSQLEAAGLSPGAGRSTSRPPSSTSSTAPRTADPRDPQGSDTPHAADASTPPLGAMGSEVPGSSDLSGNQRRRRIGFVTLPPAVAPSSVPSSSVPSSSVPSSSVPSSSVPSTSPSDLPRNLLAKAHAMASSGRVQPSSQHEEVLETPEAVVEPPDLRPLALSTALAPPTDSPPTSASSEATRSRSALEWSQLFPAEPATKQLGAEGFNTKDGATASSAGAHAKATEDDALRELENIESVANRHVARRLLREMLHGHQMRSRLLAAKALLDRAGGCAATAFSVALDHDRDEEEVAKLLEFLGRTGANTALDAVTSRARSTSPVVRAAAWDACIRLLGHRPRDLMATIEAALADEDPRVRRRAVLSLSAAPGLDLSEHLVPLLQDRDPQTRRVACVALASRDTPLTRRALALALLDGALTVRRSAADALGRFLGEDLSWIALAEESARHGAVGRLRARLASRTTGSENERDRPRAAHRDVSLGTTAG